jgi:hypothetical protein
MRYLIERRKSNTIRKKKKKSMFMDLIIFVWVGSFDLVAY